MFRDKRPLWCNTVYDSRQSCSETRDDFGVTLLPWETVVFRDKRRLWCNSVTMGESRVQRQETTVV